MTSWRKMIISAALLILTSAAFDLLVVDFWLPVFCDQASSENDPSSSDDCFCCCAHIVLTKPTQVEPVQVSGVAKDVPSRFMTSAEPAGIYHPPRNLTL